MSDPQPPAAGGSLLRKVIITSVVGVLTFVVSQRLDREAGVTLPQQVELGILVGGITLLTQFLHEFEQGIRELGRVQAKNLARLNRATEFFALVEGSALRTEAITELVSRAGALDAARPELLRNLAHHELERVSNLLRALKDSNEVNYEGEDREWLLGLARYVRSSISATSLATVDAGTTSFEGGLWHNDLGGRYLDLQREATERGVTIRRIFVFDGDRPLDRADFTQVSILHRDSGVEVRQLDSSTVPPRLRDVIFDFVLFDDVLSYETTPATRMGSAGKPAIITTRLILDEKTVHGRVQRFESLWNAAQPIPLALPPDRPIRAGQAGSTSERPAKA